MDRLFIFGSVAVVWITVAFSSYFMIKRGYAIPKRIFNLIMIFLIVVFIALMLI